MLRYAYALLSVAVIFLILFIPAYTFLDHQHAQKMRLHFDARLENAALQFNAVRNAYDLLAQNVYDHVINTDEVLSIIKRANSLDEKGRETLRKELYDKLLPLYKNLQKQNVRQLHFHLKNSISFLRFHRPGKYGDSLEGIRYSIDKVNRTRRPVFGFEEGRIFNGFRHVFPLEYEGKFAGSMEISYSFNAIKIEESKLYNAYYSFMLNKEIISKKVWKEEQDNYVPSRLSPDYLYDKATLSKKTEYGFSTDLIRKIDAAIADEAAEKLKSQKAFLLSTKIRHENYIVMFIPIYNIEKKQVAYYLSYEKDPTQNIVDETRLLETLIAAITALLLSLMIVLYYISQKRTYRALELMATTDPLTRIANRNKLSIILEQSMQLAMRYKLPLSVIFFDIDDFKKINDTFGHDMGDTVLTTTARIISEQLRSSDTLARWGGEEFIIVLPETQHRDAKILAEKYRKLIEHYKFLPDITVTCSFGVTQLREDDDERSLLRRVDDALYSAKEDGKNVVVDIA